MMSQKEKKNKKTRRSFLYFIFICILIILCINFTRNDCKDNIILKSLPQSDINNNVQNKKFSGDEKDQIVRQGNVSSTLGVAINIITDRPRNPGGYSQSNLVALLHNIVANLPDDWPIQIFTTSKSMPFMLTFPGIQTLVDKQRLILQQVPVSHDDLNRRELLLSPWMWSACLHKTVFLFDGTSALCGNSPYKISDFIEYDWIGAAWKWAKLGSPHEFGGNGALSLRNRDLVLKVLNKFMNDEFKQEKKVEFETRYAVFKGNEDMWYVKKLFEMNNTHGNIEDNNENSQMIKLAPRNISMTFAVEELYDEKKPIPFGVYHTMRSMTDKAREHILRECPEAKRLFSAKHENGK